MRVAFLGLGVMGFPMAGHIQKGGHEVTVWNRSAEKAEEWAETHGGKQAESPRDAARDAELVFMCLGNDASVRATAYGEQGALAGMAKHAILVDNTTASAALAQELFEKAAERGVQFIDAPVSGGQAGAENGQLTVMCGGEEASFGKAKPVIDCYAKACLLMGSVGAGQLAKMVNQICIAGLVQGLSEAMNFGMKAGLDMEKVITAISKGAAQSWQMDNRAKTMCAGKFDFGFAVDLMRKDLGICLATAHQNGARLPVTALVDQFYAQVQARGGNRWDTSSLIDLLMRD